MSHNIEMSIEFDNNTSRSTDKVNDYNKGAPSNDEMTDGNLLIKNNIEESSNTSTEKNLEATDVNSNLYENNSNPSKVKDRSQSRKKSTSSCSSNSSYDHKKRKTSSRRHKREKKREKEKSHKSRKERSRKKSRSPKRERSRSSSRRRRDRDEMKKRNKSSKNEKRRRRDDSISSASDNSEEDRKNFYEERRKVRQRSRSNSALRIMKMKNLDNACGYYQRFYQRPHEDNDPKKPQLYWDGYQWVIRPNSLSQQNFDVIKPGRKVIIANVPLQLNILVNDLKNYLIENILDKNVISRKDVKDINNIIRGIELDYEKNTAILAMESTDLAKKMALLDGIILLGYTLRFSLYQDIDGDETSCSNVNKAKALANSAHLSAKSAAIAWAAFQSFSKNDDIQLNLNSSLLTQTSKVLKVMNILDAKQAPKMKPEKLTEILGDIKDELKKFGQIIHSIIIGPGQEKIGAELGAVFVEFDSARSAELCKKGMHRRRYEKRDLKFEFLEENAFRQEILQPKIEEPNKTDQ